MIIRSFPGNCPVPAGCGLVVNYHLQLAISKHELTIRTCLWFFSLFPPPPLLNITFALVSPYFSCAQRSPGAYRIIILRIRHLCTNKNVTKVPHRHVNDFCNELLSILIFLHNSDDLIISIDLRCLCPPGGDGHVCVGVIEHGDQRAVAQPSQPAPHQGLKVSSFKVNTDNLLCGDKVSNVKLDA